MCLLINSSGEQYSLSSWYLKLFVFFRLFVLFYLNYSFARYKTEVIFPFLEVFFGIVLSSRVECYHGEI